MVFIRYFLYFLGGAVLAATSMFAYLMYVLVAGGGDPQAVGFSVLLLEVMELHKFALFGGFLALFGSLLYDKWYVFYVRYPGWLFVGAFAGFTVPWLAGVFETGRIPTASELYLVLNFGNRYLVSGLIVGFIMASLETIHALFAGRRETEALQKEEISYMPDPEELIREERRRIADEYLAKRQQEQSQ